MEEKSYFCSVVSLTLQDLTYEKEKRKLQLIHNQILIYNPKKLIEALEDRSEIFRKEIEDRRKETGDLKREIDDRTKNIEELTRKKEELNKNIVEMDTRMDSLEKAIKENKTNQEKELKKFDDDHKNNMKKMNDSMMGEIDEAKRYSHEKKIIELDDLNKRIEEEVSHLKDDNESMKNDLKQSEDLAKPSVYLGAVCLNLQANMYQYVLRDQYAEDFPYKVKDIEEDLDDDDLLNDKEREEAKRKWEELQKKIKWDGTLVGTMKMLQKKRNPMVQPECLSLKGAESAAEELNKQGKLKGKTSFERVQKIIEMWKKSLSLVSSIKKQ